MHIKSIPTNTLRNPCKLLYRHYSQVSKYVIIWFNCSNFKHTVHRMSSSVAIWQKCLNGPRSAQSCYNYCLVSLQWRREGVGRERGVHPGRHCAGGGIWRGKNMEFWNFTVHTNAIVVTTRISIGDLIAGVRAATKTFGRAANTLAPPLTQFEHFAPSLKTFLVWGVRSTDTTFSL